MSFLRRKINLLLIGGVIASAVFFGATPASAASLNGRVLLQVQDKGQAWYVSPLNSKRYYLGRPDDAFAVMRALGLGVSNADMTLFWNSKAPARLAGRILLQVESKGQAYYVSPLTLKLYYLGRPADAFNLMRAQGLGITNADLARIPVATIAGVSTSAPAPASVSAAPTSSSSSTSSAIGSITARFSFKFQNSAYEISQNLSASLYSAYEDAPKSYSYSGAMDQATAREFFYGLFLKTRAGDTSISALAGQVKAIAVQKGWSDDQAVEFALALVQYIPYDNAKLDASGNRNVNPYYPYETLYLDRGVCSDKTFLAVAILRQLGYGAAILDFPDENHTAAGISCPAQYSVNGSGYCYIETTNYFPISIIPQSISSGQAQTTDNGWDSLFNTSILGTIEIYQKSAGKTYQGAAAVRARVQELSDAQTDLKTQQAAIATAETDIRAQESTISALKAEMDAYYNNSQLSQYNAIVPQYNAAVNAYNADIADYQALINAYNSLVSSFNANVKSFYQK